MERLTLFLASAAMLIGIATAVQVTCYDCYFYSVIGKTDDNCNTATEFHKVDTQTCDGMCYTSTYHLLGTFFVGRGCDTDCKNGTTETSKVPGIKVYKTCCEGEKCNNKVISGGESTKVSLVALCLASAIAFLSRL